MGFPGLAARTARTLLCLVVLAFVAAVPAAAQHVRVGVYQNSPKVDYQPGKPPQGLFIDVIETIAQREGWDLEYVPGTFAQGLARLGRDEIDLMPDVARTPEREKHFDFPREPVLSSWNQVYARAGSGIRSLLDLQGRRVAVLEGSVQESFFADLAASFGVTPTIVRFPDYASAFAAVVAGQADAVVSNPLYGAARARGAGLEDTAIIFAPTGLFFAAPHGARRPLLAALDRQMAALKQDPSSPYYAAMRRWIATEPQTVLPPWLRPVALAGALLLSLGLLWILTLRRTASRLRESEQRQRQVASEIGRIFHYSLDAICVLDAELRLVRVSDACVKLWGWRAAELVGRAFPSLIAPDDRSAAIALLADARGGHPTAAVESRSLDRGGGSRSIVWSAAWSEDQREFYCIARDDSERQQLLQELQSFSYSVSHDLRAPLSTISGFIGKLLADYRERLDPPSLARVERVLLATRRMGQLIDDLLDLARISRDEMRRCEVDVGALAHEVADGLRQAHPELDLRVLIAPQLHALADPRLVRIVLENLMGNAAKFSARVALPTIEVGQEVDPDTGATVFFVRDNGVGFEMRDAQDLFAPFHRLHSASEFEGSGIGLSIVSRIVGRHGGRIRAESAPGQGAVFRFTLAPAPLPAP
ncbi:ATP-binding protein [Caenimonas terrae]|uniref:histidine kinase n=1 Tax=Caenimonas terrae TaxID=696074 RepID=A0ABW0NER9_9BURK